MHASSRKSRGYFQVSCTQIDKDTNLKKKANIVLCIMDKQSVIRNKIVKERKRTKEKKKIKFCNT